MQFFSYSEASIFGNEIKCIIIYTYFWFDCIKVFLCLSVFLSVNSIDLLLFFSLTPCWKINSFLSEISACWSYKEKIERVFSVILWALPATRRSFQQLPQQNSNLMHNWQLQMQDGVFQACHCSLFVDLSSVCWHKRLLIDISTVALAGRLGTIVY